MAGNCDFNDNDLLVDGASLGNFSAVLTDDTNGDGTVSNGTILGFDEDDDGGFTGVNTGWFYSTDAGALATVFAGLGDGALAIQLDDVDPGDNFYDFTLGVDGGLIDVGSGPQVTEATEPVGLSIFGLGLAALGLVRRRWKA